MITITKKVSYEFDYKHNLNNNFNTAKFDQTRRTHPFYKQSFEIFCNKIIVGKLVFKSLPPCVLTLLCLGICVTTTEYCLIGLKIKHHHHYKGDYRRKINTT
jgi:hypothetical protein